jgi:AraC-like DNA-binding protein
MVIAGVRGAAEGETFAVVPPGADHTFRSPAPNRFLVVDLVPGPDAIPAGAPFRPVDARLDAFSRLLAIEARVGSFSDPLVGDALWRYALTIVSGRRLNRTDAPTVALPLAERIRDAIESQLASPLSLAGIADDVGVSPAHASRVFRRAYGTSIVAYVQEARVDRAKRLLVDTDRSVTEIAFVVGFTSPAYFSRLFTRLTGQAPSSWRSLMRGSGINPRGS